MDTHACRTLENARSWCLQGLSKVFLGTSEASSAYLSRKVPKKTKNNKARGPGNNHNLRESPPKTTKNKESELFQRQFLETVPNNPNIPKPISEEMSIFLETVLPKKQTPRTERVLRDSPRKGRDSEIFLETTPMAWNLCIFCIFLEYAHFEAYGFWYCWFLGTVSNLEKYTHFRCRRGSGIFWAFCLFGIVSKNMLSSRPMGFDTFGFS